MKRDQKFKNHDQEFPNVTAAAAAAKSLQSCPTLCDPIDGSPPGSPIPGIFQARTLEWVAIAFSNVTAIKWQNQELSPGKLAGPLTIIYCPRLRISNANLEEENQVRNRA